MSEKAENLIFFLTGNPPIPGVYNDFHHQLKALSPQNTIYEIPLYTKNTKMNDLSLSRLFQINANMIIDIIEENPYKNIILIGHSIGCANILNQYDRFKEFNLQIVFIQPFVKPCAGNLIFLKIFQNPLVNAFLKYLVGFFSNFRSIYLIGIKAFTNNSSKSKLIAKEFNFSFIKRLLKLLKSYLPYFESHPSQDYLKKINPTQCALIYSRKDFWCNQENISLFDQVSSRKELPINHDFCLSFEQSKLVSDEVNSIIKNPANISSELNVEILSYDSSEVPRI